MNGTRYMETSTAARALGVSATTIKKWELAGKLVPPIVTIGGRRLFTVEQVEDLRAQRAVQHAAAARGAA